MWTWERREYRATQHYGKLQHYWSLTPLQRCSRCIPQPKPFGPRNIWDCENEWNRRNTEKTKQTLRRKDTARVSDKWTTSWGISFYISCLSLSAWVSYGQHERRCSRACGEDASFTDVKIKPQIENETRRCDRRHAPEALAEIWKKVSKLSFSVRGRRLTFGARRGLAAGAARGLEQVEKSA